MKKLFSCLVVLSLSLALCAPCAVAYHDIPVSGALSGEVRKAISYGLMNGYSPSAFGYTDSMTRAQFVTVMGRMLGWFDGSTTLVKYTTEEMQVDAPNAGTPYSVSSTYYHAINKAAELDVVDRTVPFRPNEAITRVEMAEMLVRGLGLKSAAAILEKENSLPFTDVAKNSGYVAAAYAVGLTKGTSATTFSPDSTATRAQAAAMLVRIYEKLQRKTDFVHGFYALSSYSQLELAGSMDAVSAGWSRMTWDGEEAVLSTTSAGGNEYYVPTGYGEVTDYLKNHEVPLHLNVFMDTSGGLRDLLASDAGRTMAVEEIIHELTVEYNAIGRNPYSGVTIDFESLRSDQKEQFTMFLVELRAALDAIDKQLYVCVSPVLLGGAWYDGYDYRVIGEIADKVILMAYDYEARDMSGYKGAAIRSGDVNNGHIREWFSEASRNAPDGQVFLSLMAITDPETGVQDHSKLLLGISSKNVAWEIDENYRLVSGKPVYLSNETAYQYIRSNRLQFDSGNSYVTFENDAGQRYFMWLEAPAENLRSAKLLGVTGISLWRLGTLPMYSGWSWAPLLD